MIFAEQEKKEETAKRETDAEKLEKDINGQAGSEKEGDEKDKLSNDEEGKTGEMEQPQGFGNLPNAAKIGVIAVIAVAVAVTAALLYRKLKRNGSRKEKTVLPVQPQDTGLQAAAKENMEDQERNQSRMAGKERGQSQMVGKVHNIGRRREQQDSFGVTDVKGGRFAVVADGMGGLAEGDKVSQKIVLAMMQDAARLSVGNAADALLYRMVSHANQEVARMLGTSGQYKSGSTVIAVLAGPDYFHWISVGDSRIYLFSGGRLLQVNREHVYEMELLRQAVNQEISFEEIQAEKQRKGLTSFIGMGELKYVDGSMRPVEVMPGDKVLLMSDGVFNTLPEREICRILSETEDAGQAAAEIEAHVLAHQNPKQDNFTAVILDF